MSIQVASSTTASTMVASSSSAVAAKNPAPCSWASGHSIASMLARLPSTTASTFHFPYAITTATSIADFCT